MKEQNLQTKESQERPDQNQQIKDVVQTKQVQHRLSVDDGSSKIALKKQLSDDGSNYDDSQDKDEIGDDDRRLSVQSNQSIQSEYIRTQSRRESSVGELDDEDLEEFYRILSKSSSMTFKRKKKKSTVTKQDDKATKEASETSRHKNNVYLNINDNPIKLSRPKTNRSRSHTTISNKPNLTPTSSADRDQDGQSSSKAALLTPQSNIAQDFKRNRSISAPLPLSEQAKSTDNGNSKPPEIRINEKDVVKVVVPTTANNDQSPK